MLNGILLCKNILISPSIMKFIIIITLVIRSKNKLSNMLRNKVKSAIVQKIKEAKYFSMILDCTLDVSHQEQVTLILVVLIIFNFHDTTGQGLFEEIQNILKILALYTPCGYHSINLTLCDITSSYTNAKDFFGVLQRIYTVFSHSTKRWKILRDNVNGLTIKPLSQMHWESYVNSVHGIKTQISDIKEPLVQLAEQDNDLKIKSEVESLATHGIRNFEFLLAMVIWFELLTVANEIGKILEKTCVLMWL
ncbi:hypothetical protein CR513_10494, partial [Mucuna pruriens]